MRVTRPRSSHQSRVPEKDKAEKEKEEPYADEELSESEEGQKTIKSGCAPHLVGEDAKDCDGLEER